MKFIKRENNWFPFGCKWNKKMGDIEDGMRDE
jgi:hypothetical protein